MKKFKTAVIGMFVAAFASAGAQAAMLSSQDLFATGDGLVTRDAVSNLDWLDLSSTAGLSVDQVRSGAGGWLDQGFRYASFGEFKSFLFSAGLTELSPGAYVAPTTGEMVGSFEIGRSFFDLIGAPAGTLVSYGGFLAPTSCDDGGPWWCGHVDPDTGLRDGPDSFTYAIRLSLNADRQPYGIGTVDAVGPTTTVLRSDSLGSYLVRDAIPPVPEPESYALMALGLGIVGWTVRRKKAKA